MNYIIYKITNIINNKIYIGCHQTDNLDDGYMGSGTILKRAQNKYGKENFYKRVIFECENKDEMFNKEKELVNEEFIKEDSNYNVKVGGSGGWTKEASIKGGKSSGNRSLTNRLGIFSEENIKNHILRVNSEEWKLHVKENIQPLAVTAAKSDIANIKRKETMSLHKHQQGKNNSQYGTIWITNGIDSKKIKKEDTIPLDWKRGQTRRKRG